MKLSKVFAIATVFIMMITLPIFVSHAAESPTKPIKLKLTTIYPPGPTYAQAIAWYCDELKKQSNGMVEVEIYWSGSLAKAGDEPKMVSAGAVEMGVSSPMYNPSEFPLGTGADLMFTSASDWVRYKALMEVYDKYKPFRDEYEKMGLVLLGSTQPGPCIILAKKPITKMEDLKGLRIRAAGPGAKAIESLGATPVAIPFPEVYTALERGTIDAATTMTFGSIYPLKFHEVCQYIIDPKFGPYVTIPLFINKRVFDALPSRIREVFKEVTEKWGDVQIDMLVKTEREMAANLVKEGAHITTLSEAEAARWKNQVAPGFFSGWIAEVEKRGVKNAKEFLDLWIKTNEKWTPSDRFVVPWADYVK